MQDDASGQTEPAQETIEQQPVASRSFPLGKVLGMFTLLGLFYVLIFPALCPRAHFTASIGARDVAGRIPMTVDLFSFVPIYGLGTRNTQVQLVTADNLTTELELEWGPTPFYGTRARGVLSAMCVYPRKERFLFYIERTAWDNATSTALRARLSTTVMFVSRSIPIWCRFLDDYLPEKWRVSAKGVYWQSELIEREFPIPPRADAQTSVPKRGASS